MGKSDGPFKLASTRPVYQNPWIRVREDRVIRPDGQPGVFGVVEMVPGVSVVAIDDQGRVALVEEYKYAVGRETLEVVSGAMEPGESPFAAAQRELREELGREASAWSDLGSIDPFTTVIRSPNRLFLARHLRPAAGRPDAGERLRIVWLPFQTAVERVMAGTITHAASCVALLKVDRHHREG